MRNIPLPRLMSADGLHFQRSLRPVKATVELNIIPLSTASLQMPDGESLPARAYVEMFTALGSAGYFRVRSPQASYGDETPFAELEHAAVEIGDYLVTGKIQDTMTASAALQTVFGHYRGNLWQIASTSINDIVVVDIDHETVLSGLLAIMDQLPDYHMDFDFSTRPWTLRVVGNDSGVTAEGRLGRNVKSARITYDDSELCTRAYYEIEDEDGDGMPFSRWYTYDSSTIHTYGVVERVVQVDISSDEAKALRVVKDYLRKHQEPIISVEIDGQELSQITGESLDRFQIGKMFRLALPDYHVTVDRNITELIFDDVYGKPLQITVHLASELDTVVSFLHDVATGTGSSVGPGGGTKKQSDKWKEYYTGLQQTDYFWDMYARKVNENGEILKQAGLYIDAGGVLQYADDNENMLYARLKVTASYIRAELTDAKNGLYSRIEQTASYIRSEVSDTANGLQSRIEQTASHLQSEFEDTANGLYSRIEQTASYLRAEYQDTAASLRSEIELTASHLRTDFEDTANGLRSSIEQTASRVSIVVDGNGNVKPASIVASINNGSSSVAIDADHVNITGTTKLNDVVTIVDGGAVFSRLVIFAGGSQQVSVNNGKVTAQTLQAGTMTFSKDSMGNYYNLTYSELSNYVKDASVNSSGTTLTLTKVSGDVVTFKRVASLSGAWSGNTYTVSASPTGIVTPVSTTLMSLSGTGSATITGKLVSQVFNIMVNGSGSTPVASGAQLTAVIDASGVYSNGQSNGWSLARGKVSLPGSGSGGSITAKWPGASYNTQESRTYELSTDGNNSVILRYNSASSGQPQYTTAARINHNGYNTGYDAVGAPSVTFTAVNAQSTGNPSGTASVANKTGGGTRRTSIGMALSRSVYTKSGGTTERCVNVSFNNTTVGRISIQADYDAGYNTGYDAGYDAGWSAYYHDSHWMSPYNPESEGKAWVPSNNPRNPGWEEWFTMPSTETPSVSTVSRGWNSYSGRLPSERSITIRGRLDQDVSVHDDLTVSLRLYKSGSTVYLQHNQGGTWTSVAMI